MTSRSADCVLGEVRLISSASAIWHMMAPGWNSISPVLKLTMVKPVTSLGTTSGVNWMRLKEQSSDLAKAPARVVLPVPGTSSMSTWPLHSMAIKRSSITSSLPTMTLPMFCFSAVITWRGLSISPLLPLLWMHAPDGDAKLCAMTGTHVLL